MPGYDGNGNFVRVHNWTADAANGLDINATEMDAEDNGIAAGLSNAVTRDGQGRMSADFLPNADNTLNLGSGPYRWKALNVVTLTATNITGSLTIAQTAAEIAASVTPVNYAYAPGNVLRYGTNTTPGTTDMTAAFVAMWAQAAQTGGADCYVPPGTYAQLSTFGAYPANVKTRGGGRNITKIVKGFNGDTFSAIGSYAQISDIWFAGQGGTYTGRWSPIAAGTRSQIVCDCQMSDYAAGTGASVVDFVDVTSGSQFIMDSAEVWQTGGTTGTGLYAFKIQDAVELSAVPRHFSNIETQGFCAFSFGGANDLYIGSSTIGDLLYSANTRGTHVSNSRWLNQAAANINGHNNTITGCDINPQLTLVSGTDANSIKGNSYNNLPVIDNSGNDRNDVDFWEIAFTPSLISGGTINNGVITGRYQRQGAKIIFDINYTVGSTDTLTGTLQFSLPVARVNGNICQAGMAVLTHTTTQYQAMLQIPGNVNYFTLLYQVSAAAASPVTTAPVTNTVPATWTSTQPDTMRMSGSYQL